MSQLKNLHKIAIAVFSFAAPFNVPELRKPTLANVFPQIRLFYDCIACVGLKNPLIFANSKYH